ncbi:hypothetical protein F2Q69_00013108 [Brassica cretica]|uniref:Uncharacterized protein n=1 Tax=Brassica cretica TaxID=69181 RepID=A0A8S9QUL3_BRACR|nr:hypothetical protein F2Q69_00013108 [Brassica cretica]
MIREVFDGVNDLSRQIANPNLHVALIPLGAAWATSSPLNYGRLPEPVGWRQGWFATQRHKITLYCLRWIHQEFLPLSETNVLELNRES